MTRFIAALLLALLAFAPPVRAQSLLSFPAPSVQPDRTPLAEAADVPFALLLGIDGTTPLFVNPARAARYRHRFAYGTVGASGQPNTVSLAALFGSRDSRWLLTAENLALRSDDSRSDMTTATRDYPGLTRTDVDTQTTTSARTTVGSRGRAMLVGKTDFGGYAFGLFGGYGLELYESDFQAERTSDEDRTEPFPETLDAVQTNAQRRERRREVYGVGAEVALAGQTWDIAASVSFQGSAARDGLRVLEDGRIETMAESSSNGSFARLSVVGREDIAEASASPQGVGFDAIGALRTGISRDDYLFASAAGTFRSGTGTYAQTFSLNNFVRTNVNGVITENSTVEERSDDGEADLSDRLLRFTLGYIYVRDSRKVRVLAGIIPTVSLDRLESVDASQPEVQAVRSAFEETTLGVQLPLHIKAPVTRSLAVFGGGVYSYDYLTRERTETPLQLQDPFQVSIEQERVESTTAFLSRTRLYGGALLALRSGLTAQAAFRGDLADFERWTVSLGYRF